MLAQSRRRSVPGVSARRQSPGLQALQFIVLNQHRAGRVTCHSRDPPVNTQP